MKKIIALFLTITILFSSCSVYKNTTVENVEVGKTYVITVKPENREFVARCENITDDTIYFKINDNQTSFPKSYITSIQRKKVSPVVLIGGAAAAIAIGVLVIDSDKKGFIGQETDN